MRGEADSVKALEAVFVTGAVFVLVAPRLLLVVAVTVGVLVFVTLILLLVVDEIEAVRVGKFDRVAERVRDGEPVEVVVLDAVLSKENPLFVENETLGEVVYDGDAVSDKDGDEEVVGDTEAVVVREILEVRVPVAHPELVPDCVDSAVFVADTMLDSMPLVV